MCLGHCAAPGFFAFTTEIPEVTSGFQILPDRARYAHSESYLREQAERAGFVPVASGRINAYPDYPMLQSLYRKP